MTPALPTNFALIFVLLQIIIQPSPLSSVPDVQPPEKQELSTQDITGALHVLGPGRFGAPPNVAKKFQKQFGQDSLPPVVLARLAALQSENPQEAMQLEQQKQMINWLYANPQYVFWLLQQQRLMQQARFLVENSRRDVSTPGTPKPVASPKNDTIKPVSSLHRKKHGVIAYDAGATRTSPSLLNATTVTNQTDFVGATIPLEILQNTNGTGRDPISRGQCVGPFC